VCAWCLYRDLYISVSSLLVRRTMPEGLRDQLLLTISKTFHCTPDRAEQIFVELMLCVRKKHLVSQLDVSQSSAFLPCLCVCVFLLHEVRSVSNEN